MGYAFIIMFLLNFFLGILESSMHYHIFIREIGFFFLSLFENNTRYCKKIPIFLSVFEEINHISKLFNKNTVFFENC